MADEEGATCDECGQKIGPRGCCLTEMRRTRKELHQELLDAAREVLECLGGPQGYFPVVGAPKTNRLKEAVIANGARIIYQRGTAFEVDPLAENPWKANA